MSGTEQAAINVISGYPVDPMKQPVPAEVAGLFKNVQSHRDTVALLIADALYSYAVGSKYYVAPGDIIDAGGFRYEVAVSGATDHHVITAGGVKLYVQPGADGYYAESFSGTLDENAAQAAFDGVASATETKHLIFRGNWTIASTVTLSDPHNVSIDARGALFTTGNEILMFDLNGRADPTFADNESRQNFSWVGGRFGCTITSPTKATAMRAMGFRHARIEVEDFGLTSGGFYRDIITGGKDTVYIVGHKTFDVVNASIEFPPWSMVGGPLLFFMRDIHCSLGGGGKFVKSYVPLTNCAISNYSCNLGTGAAHDGVIDISKNILMGVPSVTGTFALGETLTGGVSGATCILAEVYVHDFAFQIPQNLTWLVSGNRTGTFVIGETVTGGTSGASAVIGNNAGYLSQNSEWSDFSLLQPAHWESGSGASGAICIKLSNNEISGIDTANHVIEVGLCGVNGGGAIGVQLKHITHAKISGRFAQSVGFGTPIKLDVTCGDITIARPTYITGLIDLNGMNRTELDLSAFDVQFATPYAVTGWTPKNPGTVGTSSGTSVDFSTAFPNYTTVGGLAPIAFDLQVMVNDSGSAAAASARPRFRMHHPDASVANTFHLLNIRGIPDDEQRMSQWVVTCDANGQIEYDSIESSAGALDVFLYVAGMRY